MASSSATHTVKVQVYDLSGGLARQLSLGLIGKQIDAIYHTGIAVYGREFYYGQGICMDPEAPTCRTPYGTPIEVVDLGKTAVDEDTFTEFLHGIGPRYLPGTYHVLDHNCNTFSNEVAQFLVGKEIPSKVTNLPAEFLSTPMGAMFRPMIDSMMQQGHQAFDQAPSVAPPPVPRPPSTQLKVLSATAPDPVLFTHGDVGKITSTLSSSITEATAFTPSATAKTALGGLAASLGSESKVPLPPGVTTLVAECIDKLPAAKVFPALDVLRLAFAHPVSGPGMIKEWVGASGKLEGRLMTSLVGKYRLHEGPLSEKEATAAGRSTVVHLLALRALANVLSSAGDAPGRTWASSGPKPLEIFVESAVHGLQSSDARVRMAAATVAYNVAGLVSGDNDDAATAMVSALAHALRPEQDGDEEATFRSLMALGTVLQRAPGLVPLLGALDFDISRFTKDGAKVASRLADAASDVTTLLK